MRLLPVSDVNLEPAQIIAYFVQRWKIEVTFAETRAHLGVETQRQWYDKAITQSNDCPPPHPRESCRSSPKFMSIQDDVSASKPINYRERSCAWPEARSSWIVLPRQLPPIDSPNAFAVPSTDIVPARLLGVM